MRTGRQRRRKCIRPKADPGDFHTPTEPLGKSDTT
jgi:hypothetical protein